MTEQLINAQDVRPGDRIRFRGDIHYVIRTAHCWGRMSSVVPSRHPDATPYVELVLRDRRGAEDGALYEWDQQVFLEVPNTENQP